MHDKFLNTRYDISIMIDISNQLLQISINDSYNEADDIILPDTYWGELLYILFCIKNIIKQQEHRKEKVLILIRQIKIHYKWMKIK